MKTNPDNFSHGAGGDPADVSALSAPRTLRWKLADLFPDDDEFHRHKKAVQNRLPEIDRYPGRLAESAETLAAALGLIDDLARELSRLGAYASMRSDEDTRLQERQGMRQEIGLIRNEFSRRIAWLATELLGMDEAVLLGFAESHPALEPFRFYLNDLLRTRPHVLSRPEEDILAAAGLVTGAASAVFDLFHNAEQPREEITLRDGTAVRLTPAAYARWRASPVREDRKAVQEGFFKSYEAFKGTLGQTLYEGLKSHVFYTRTRKYDSSLEAALFGDNVPASVYTHLIEQVHRHLPLLHRYFGLRARALGVDRLAYHDLVGPLVPDAARRYTPEEAETWVRRSTAPLGPAYREALDACFGERWIDWNPVPGKRSGAYASGSAYDAHPYILLNYNGDYNSLSTLTHEVGHAIHSWFSNRSQPHATAQYSIFVAEVASTFNEALLNAEMLEATPPGEKGDRHRMFLLGNSLDGIRTTLFRQAMFAEFERTLHQEAEADRPLTGDRLSALYLDLLRRYHGHDQGVVEIPDPCAVEWAAIPHFHYNFYVYQYATGITAAITLAEAVRGGREGARDRYLDFLRSGGSDYPLAILRRAGVDLESPEPYALAMTAMSRKMDLLESLLKRSGR